MGKILSAGGNFIDIQCDFQEHTVRFMCKSKEAIKGDLVTEEIKKMIYKFIDEFDGESIIELAKRGWYMIDLKYTKK